MERSFITLMTIPTTNLEEGIGARKKIYATESSKRKKTMGILNIISVDVSIRERIFYSGWTATSETWMAVEAFKTFLIFPEKIRLLRGESPIFGSSCFIKVFFIEKL